MRIGIFADIHGNILALNSVLRDLKNYKIEEFICCGDYLGYYYEPVRVISHLQNLSKLCVVGNHDLAFLHLYKMTRNSRLKAFQDYYQHNGSGLRIAFEMLEQGQIEWLKNLPLQINLKFENIRCSIFHGIPNSVTKYLYPTTSSDCFRKFMKNKDSKLFLGGHSHHQFSKRIGEKLYINPGSIGQPRDVGGRAAWAILQIDGDDINFDFVHSSYDFEKVRTRAAKLDPHIPYLQSIFLRGLNV